MQEYMLLHSRQSSKYAGAYAPAYQTVIQVWRSICSCIPDSHPGMKEHMLLHTRQSSTQNNKYQVSRKQSCFSRWWAHSRTKHVKINKCTKNKLCTYQVGCIYKIIQRCTFNKTQNLATRRSLFDSTVIDTALTLILLTWRIWWAPNNESRWQMGFNLSFKGLTGRGERETIQ